MVGERGGACNNRRQSRRLGKWGQHVRPRLGVLGKRMEEELQETKRCLKRRGLSWNTGSRREMATTPGKKRPPGRAGALGSPGRHTHTQEGESGCGEAVDDLWGSAEGLRAGGRQGSVESSGGKSGGGRVLASKVGAPCEVGEGGGALWGLMLLDGHIGCFQNSAIMNEL